MKRSNLTILVSLFAVVLALTFAAPVPADEGSYTSNSGYYNDTVPYTQINGYYGYRGRYYRPYYGHYYNGPRYRYYRPYYNYHRPYYRPYYYRPYYYGNYYPYYYAPHPYFFPGFSFFFRF